MIKRTKKKENAVRILLADDQTIVRDGLRALLETYSDMVIIGQAENGKEACERARELNPDVVLMDVRMPEMDGVEATKIIKEEEPETLVIMLTTFDDDQYIIHAMSNGASGYLLKDIGGDRLAEAIR
ncbi:MAG TPA: DNA-binding response regulator, partial [Eubacteriaceae bacterium]|nr:DNA-binding response regulator [Eubacteriaceae bacterium]